MGYLRFQKTVNVQGLKLLTMRFVHRHGKQALKKEGKEGELLF